MRKGAFSVHALHQALRILDLIDVLAIIMTSEDHELLIRSQWTPRCRDVIDQILAMTWQVTILDWIWCHSQTIMRWSILALEINATGISLLQTWMATWDLLVGKPRVPFKNSKVVKKIFLELKKNWENSTK